MFISISLCSPTDVPRPTDGSVSVIALNEAGKVGVTWRRPTLGPGQVIAGYSVLYRRSGSTSYTTRSVSGSSTTSYTITNLNLGRMYEVRVASRGHLGLSGYCCGSGKQVTTYNCERMYIIRYIVYKFLSLSVWLCDAILHVFLIVHIIYARCYIVRAKKNCPFPR